MVVIKNAYEVVYSPRATALILLGSSFMGLGLLGVAGMVVPTWLWIPLFALAVAGFVLQFVSRRVVHIWSYTGLVWCLTAGMYSLLTWAVIALPESLATRLATGAILAILFLVAGVTTCWVTQRRQRRRQMPYGPFGRLDARTGLVDPQTSPAAAQSDQDKLEQGWGTAGRLAPLTAGLAFLLVRSLPHSADWALMAVVAFFFAFAGIVGVAMALVYVRASRRWEASHGKPLRVKRL